jgi:Rab3 GTPase-activating protein catalytic subunit
VISERLLRPTAREFILRLVIPQPSPLSSSSPQRMFCLLTKDEIRIAGSFTNDFIVTS